MFTVEERNRVRERLLQFAGADADIAGAAITGSYVTRESDNWSDIDLAFAILGQLTPALERWTEMLYRDFSALHHWDLRRSSTIYRVFLLQRCLEVDIAFTPAAEFRPHGPKWQTIFGKTIELEARGAPRRDEMIELATTHGQRRIAIGLAWHHLLHARACIERAKLWQAEYWISGARDQVFVLACLRLGHTAHYAKGVDSLPLELTEPLEATFICSLDKKAMNRALAGVAAALEDELERGEPTLASRLRDTLAELATVA